ncbi:MAG: hypothetical protein K9N48_06290 [Verrucomicrobia bacterium]|nr:hypothetical protein [Verrucomicrobiota bacterium]
MKTVVILVDNKRRDLPGLALVAHHLKKMNVRCELEPLEAWRSVLWAHKPDMIMFNHLTAKHLEEYSRQLHQRGILTAVLPNEGILYDKDVLEFNASKFHNDAHIDHFFCWNQAHADAVKKAVKTKTLQVHLIGVPRFDFYFPPFAKPRSQNRKAKVLVCTNFVFSKFRDAAPSVAERFFGRWIDSVPAYRDWPELIKVNYESKLHFLEFLDAAVRRTDYEILLRPHPNEDTSLYDEWYSRLDEAVKARVGYERDRSISDLIMECDIEVACDTCTTSLESWIAGKPTIELHLTDHPVFHHDFIACLNSVCNEPEELPSLITSILENGEQETLKQGRREHLRKWCNMPDGTVSRRFATILKDILEDSTKPDFSSLSLSDVRRGLRLKMYKKLNLPCSFKPLLPVKYALNKKKYYRKMNDHRKTIMPSDVKYWADEFESMGV